MARMTDSENPDNRVAVVGMVLQIINRDGAFDASLRKWRQSVFQVSSEVNWIFGGIFIDPATSQPTFPLIDLGSRESRCLAGPQVQTDRSTGSFHEIQQNSCSTIVGNGRGLRFGVS
jgi:hypothetical protein